MSKRRQNIARAFFAGPDRMWGALPGGVSFQALARWARWRAAFFFRRGLQGRNRGTVPAVGEVSIGRRGNDQNRCTLYFVTAAADRKPPLRTVSVGRAPWTVPQLQRPKASAGSSVGKKRYTRVRWGRAYRSSEYRPAGANESPQLIADAGGRVVEKD